jgi:hypothetical protein
VGFSVIREHPWTPVVRRKRTPLRHPAVSARLTAGCHRRSVATWLALCAHYAALTLGAYRAERVEVELAATPALGDAPLGLFAGTVDICWGGPLRINRFYESRTDCDLVCFGEAVTRDPFMLIGRIPRPDFSLADLYDLRLATVAEVPTPWLWRCCSFSTRMYGVKDAIL